MTCRDAKVVGRPARVTEAREVKDTKGCCTKARLAGRSCSGGRERQASRQDTGEGHDPEARSCPLSRVSVSNRRDQRNARAEKPASTAQQAAVCSSSQGENEVEGCEGERRAGRSSSNSAPTIAWAPLEIRKPQPRNAGPLSGGRRRGCIFPDNSTVSQEGNARGNNNAKQAASNRLMRPARLVLVPRGFLGLFFIRSRLVVPRFPSPFLPLSGIFPPHTHHLNRKNKKNTFETLMWA